MQYKFFDIPAADAEQAAAELNAFLRGHRVITVQRELVREAGGSYWALCVEYLEGAGGSASGKPGGRPRVDYKEVLSEADFTLVPKFLFGNPLSLEIPFLVTLCVALSAWPADNDCEVELRALLRSQIGIWERVEYTTYRSHGSYIFSL